MKKGKRRKELLERLGDIVRGGVLDSGTERSEARHGCPPSAMGSASAAPVEPESVQSQNAPMASLPSSDERKMKPALIAQTFSFQSGPAGLEALPCPFCGAQPKETSIEPDYWQLFCVNMECPAEVSVGAITLKRAISNWNERAGTKSVTQPAHPSAAGVSGGS